MQQNAPTLKSCCKLLHWAGKAYLLVWHILLHLAGVVFVIPPGFCYVHVIAEFPIAYCCIWHGSCLGTLHSVAFSRVLGEYPVGVRVNQFICYTYMYTYSVCTVHGHTFLCSMYSTCVCTCAFVLCTVSLEVTVSTPTPYQHQLLINTNSLSTPTPYQHQLLINTTSLISGQQEHSHHLIKIPSIYHPTQTLWTKQTADKPQVWNSQQET